MWLWAQRNIFLPCALPAAALCFYHCNKNNSVCCPLLHRSRLFPHSRKRREGPRQRLTSFSQAAVLLSSSIPSGHFLVLLPLFSGSAQWDSWRPARFPQSCSSHGFHTVFPVSTQYSLVSFSGRTLFIHIQLHQFQMSVCSPVLSTWRHHVPCIALEFKPLDFSISE